MGICVLKTSGRFVGYAVFVVAAIIMAFSVNSWSLWLDETITAQLFVSDSIGTLVQKYSTFNGSEAQMPGWVLCVWVWCKVFGTGEYALRAFNFLPVGLMLVYSAYAAMRKGTSCESRAIICLATLLAALSPFVLYNMNEARSNISLFAFSYISTLAMWRYLEDRKIADFRICVVAFLVGYLFNMLMGFLLVVLAVLALSYRKDTGILLGVKRSWGLVALSLLVALAVSAYYLMTIFVESKGGQIESPGVGNIGYVVYDYMGFSCIGPRKNALREAPDKVSLLMGYLPLMIPLLASYCIVVVHALLSLRRDAVMRRFFTAFVAGTVIFIVAAIAIKFRFWSRHLAFMLPVFFLFMSCCLLSFCRGRRRWLRAAVVFVFAAFTVLSCCNILFNPVYYKDNIKGLVQKCRELRLPSEKVFWQESDCTRVYYGLDDPLVSGGVPDAGDHGLYVWFNRMNVGSGKFIGGKAADKYGEHLRFLETRKPELLYSDCDFSIYRF